MAPCKFGHKEDRYTSSGGCKECGRANGRDNYRRNRTERIAKNKQWVAAQHKDYNYHSRLLRVYSMTREQYEEMFAAQGGRCAICRTDDPGSKHKRWHLDHCHQTGDARGILCAQCNVMIAMARDDGRILTAGVRYLSKVT